MRGWVWLLASTAGCAPDPVVFDGDVVTYVDCGPDGQRARVLVAGARGAACAAIDALPSLFVTGWTEDALDLGTHTVVEGTTGTIAYRPSEGVTVAGGDARWTIVVVDPLQGEFDARLADGTEVVGTFAADHGCASPIAPPCWQ